MHHEFVGKFFAYCVYMFCRLDLNLTQYLYKVMLSDYSDEERQGGGDFLEHWLVQQPGQHWQKNADGVPVLNKQHFAELNYLVPEEWLPGPVWADVDEALLDLALVDPDKAQGLRMGLAEDDIEDLCLDFTVEERFMGEMYTFELKPGGAAIDVTNDNREEHARLVCKWYLKTSVAHSLSAFKRGWDAVIFHDAIKPLTPRLLENLVCGSPIVTDDHLMDLKTVMNVTSADPEVKKDRFVDWFFQVLKSYDASSLKP